MSTVKSRDPASASLPLVGDAVADAGAAELAPSPAKVPLRLHPGEGLERGAVQLHILLTPTWSAASIVGFMLDNHPLGLAGLAMTVFFGVLATRTSGGDTAAVADAIRAMRATVPVRRLE